MPVRVILDGFDEFARALNALPVTLTEQAKDPVRAAAAETMTELLAGYPSGTSGHMKAGVSQDVHDEPAHFAVVVLSTAPEAHLWEYGTRVRSTQKGWNRGSEQGAREKSLHAIADTHQPPLGAALAALLKANSFEVDGAA